jgi:hypothetical protein
MLEPVGGTYQLLGDIELIGLACWGLLAMYSSRWWLGVRRDGWTVRRFVSFGVLQRSTAVHLPGRYMGMDSSTFRFVWGVTEIYGSTPAGAVHGNVSTLL